MQPGFYGARELRADGPIVLTFDLFLQGPSAQKSLVIGHRWPDVASLGTTSSTRLMRPCTASQETAVISWLGTARNVPSPFSVSPGYSEQDPTAGAAEMGEGSSTQDLRLEVTSENEEGIDLPMTSSLEDSGLPMTPSLRAAVFL